MKVFRDTCLKHSAKASSSLILTLTVGWALDKALSHGLDKTVLTAQSFLQSLCAFCGLPFAFTAPSQPFPAADLHFLFLSNQTLILAHSWAFKKFLSHCPDDKISESSMSSNMCLSARVKACSPAVLQSHTWPHALPVSAVFRHALHKLDGGKDFMHYPLPISQDSWRWKGPQEIVWSSTLLWAQLPVCAAAEDGRHSRAALLCCDTRVSVAGPWAGTVGTCGTSTHMFSHVALPLIPCTPTPCTETSLAWAKLDHLLLWEGAVGVCTRQHLSSWLLGGFLVFPLSLFLLYTALLQCCQASARPAVLVELCSPSFSTPAPHQSQTRGWGHGGGELGGWALTGRLSKSSHVEDEGSSCLLALCTELRDCSWPWQSPVAGWGWWKNVMISQSFYCCDKRISPKELSSSTYFRSLEERNKFLHWSGHGEMLCW